MPPETSINKPQPASNNNNDSNKFKFYFKIRRVEGVKRPICASCNKPMWKHREYTRKKDGVKVVVYRCPNCGKTKSVAERDNYGSASTCIKCGHRMHKHGFYRRKRDGLTVSVLYCPKCRSSVVNKPLVIRHSREKKRVIFLDKTLNLAGAVKKVSLLRW